MSCCGSQQKLEVPKDATVIKRNETSWCRLVYRKGGYVYKVLRVGVTPAQVERKRRLALANPDLLVPFEYCKQCHTVKQVDLGDEPGDATSLQARVDERGLRVCDVTPQNVRQGRAIDWDEAQSYNVKHPRGITRIGRRVVIVNPTPQEIESLGALCVDASAARDKQAVPSTRSKGRPSPTPPQSTAPSPE